MKKTVEDSTRFLSRLGYKAIWDNILKYREQKRVHRRDDQRQYGFQVEELEVRQMLSASIDQVSRVIGHLLPFLTLIPIADQKTTSFKLIVVMEAVF